MVYPEIPACSSFYQHLVVADVPTLIRFVAILWAKTTLLEQNEPSLRARAHAGSH
jgi:hypothetical protein